MPSRAEGHSGLDDEGGSDGFPLAPGWKYGEVLNPDGAEILHCEGTVIFQFLLLTANFQDRKMIFFEGPHELVFVFGINRAITVPSFFSSVQTPEGERR